MELDAQALRQRKDDIGVALGRPFVAALHCAHKDFTEKKDVLERQQEALTCGAVEGGDVVKKALAVSLPIASVETTGAYLGHAMARQASWMTARHVRHSQACATVVEAT